MSVIVSEVYDALVSAGAPVNQARAAAAAIPLHDNLATQRDVTTLREEVASVRAEIATVKAIVQFAIFTFFPVVIGLLVKIAFFPG